MLRWLQWRRVKPHVEVTVTLGGAYLVYFVANAYLASSGQSVAPHCLWGMGAHVAPLVINVIDVDGISRTGVIATVCYGLYGASSMT